MSLWRLPLIIKRHPLKIKCNIIYNQQNCMIGSLPQFRKMLKNRRWRRSIHQKTSTPSKKRDNARWLDLRPLNLSPCHLPK